MKTYKLFALSLLFGSVTYAQTLEDAIKKTENERFDVAGSDFRKLIAKEPTRADYYFYFGENYCEHEDLDSANMVWKKGSEIDPLYPLNFIGLGKYLWFSGDTTAANVYLTKAATMTKNKNADVMRKTAAVFIYTPKMKKLDAAIALLDKAIKLDPKNVEAYILLGDALQEKTPDNASPAIKNYNLALEIMPNFPKAIVRTAKIYQRSGNDSLANVKYKEAQLLDPTYAPAYRENAELNMKLNQSSKAIENWKKYLALNNSIEARYRFATSLFTGKKYCEVIPELLAVQAGGFNNHYVERMLTTSYYECPDQADPKVSYNKGMATSDNFFAKAPENNILASDYKYRGLLLTKLGSDSLGIIELEKAVTKDPVKNAELLSEIGKMHLKAKRYSEVISAYTRKSNGVWSNLTVQELNELAKSYYFGPKDYKMSDSCYAGVILRSPTYAPAFLWKARTSYKLDNNNEKGLAKQYYEKYLELLKPEDYTNTANKSFIIEASKYLGDYYLQPKNGKDVAKAKLYWENVRTQDPNDTQAKAFFSSPEGK